MESVLSFKYQQGWLSNFELCVVHYCGVPYKSVEHAFVAAKTLDPVARQRVAQCQYPWQAKRLGRRLVLRPDWEDIKLDIMYQLVLEKFSAHPILRQKLLNTGDALLVEGNWRHDQFWGNCTCGKRRLCAVEGENHLGLILMAVRADLAGAQFGHPPIPRS
jgi:ribA/ribD-fused uncharacterized protein